MVRPRNVRYRKFDRTRHSREFLKWIDAEATRLDTTAKFIFEELLVTYRMSYLEVQALDELVTPANTVAPSITGVADVGETLSVDIGEWDGIPAPIFDIQWYRDTGTPEKIDGKVFVDYTVTLDDVGATLYAEVTATNGLGSDSENTDPTDTVIAPAEPENTVLPAITGTAELASELVVTPGTWTGHPTPDLSYQWFRVDGDDATEIEGATDATYTTTEDDVGCELYVAETAINKWGEVTVESLPTDTIEDGE